MYDPISGEFVSFGESVAVGYANNEIIGDDVSDLFSGGPQPRQLSARMAQARAVDPNAVLVKQQVDTRRRYIDLGLPSQSIAVGADALVEVRPQRTFRTEELIIPDNIADDLVLIAVSVGQNSQLAGGAPVPLSAYSAKAFRPKGVLWDTANPGITIQLLIRNIGASPVTLYGTLRGTATVR